MAILSKQTQIFVHSPSKVKKEKKVKFVGVSGVKKMIDKKEICDIEKKPLCYKRKRDDLYEDDRIKNSVMVRAKELQATLSPKLPSLVKYMLHSHVTRGFWLGLSRSFCQKYLPKEDTMMVLEDENGEVCEAKYLAAKVGLSGGWRAFSIAHKIMEGDVAVFHLIKPTRFKVYIVRCGGSNEVDGALGLLKLEAGPEPVRVDNEAGILDEMDSMTVGEIMLAYDILQESKKQIRALPSGTILAPAPLSYRSENDSSNLVSEVLDGIKLSESDVEFKDVKSINNFSIVVNGLIINSELSKHHQVKYYELCRTQNSFLHEGLLDGLNCKLAAGVIAETINIADAIRASKLVTSEENFLTWGTTLKAFEGLGMNVGFLQERMDRLRNLSRQSQRRDEAKCERDCAKDEKEMLEIKLFEVNEKINSLDAEIKSLEVNCDRLEVVFEEVAKAPW